MLEDVVRSFRETIPFINNDKVMYPEIEKSVQFLKTFDWQKMLAKQH